MPKDDIIEIISDRFERHCFNEDYENIKMYLERFNELVNYDNGYYFEIVADKGNLELIKLFVENGAHIGDNNYVTYICKTYNYIECVEYLESVQPTKPKPRPVVFDKFA
jgi:ankyrin repeat protein